MVDLLFDWFGLVCFAKKHIKCQLSYSLFQTSQTGGQWYSDTSPFSIPWTDGWPRRQTDGQMDIGQTLSNRTKPWQRFQL